MDRTDWQDFAYDYGPYAVLAVIVVFMLWIRLMPYDRVVNQSAVLFSGNDPWYHARMVHLIVEFFPNTIDFDPWSQFPYGTGRHSGFGGVFNQLIALAAIIIGLGDPSTHLINVTTAIAPPVFGAGTAVTTYFIMKELTDRWSALLAAGLLALLGGQFLTRTIVGVSDHQSAEAFFGSLAILGFIYAVRTAYREKPTVADIHDRNWIVLRRPLVASLVGGTAIASYLMTWGPGVMLVFAMGVFVVLQLLRDHWEERPTDYLTFATVVTMGTAGFLTLFYMKETDLQPTAFSVLQPLTVLGVAVGSLVLFSLARYIDRSKYEKQYYPVASLGLIFGSFVIASIIYPKIGSLFMDLAEKVYTFGTFTSASSLTVAEIQPATLDDAWRAFGSVFYIGIVGFVLMVVRVIRKNHPLELLVILWSYTIFSAYFSMIRFGYYMAINVAVLAGFAIWWTGHHLLSIDTSIDDIRHVQPYQIIGIMVILVAIVPGNVVAVSDQQPVWDTADRAGGANMAWYNELQWVQEGTPEEPLDYTARYERPADGDYQYPPDAYGVMSWWDYGHWITVQGHRIPVANPFQENQGIASAYLQAQNETYANRILESLPSLNKGDNDIRELSSAELQSIIDAQSEQENNEDVRYVMIDNQMAAGKFGAIATWTGPGFQSYVSTQEVQVGEETARLPALNDRYRQTMLARLYFQDANGLSHYRLVHETEQQSTIVSVARKRQGGWQTTGFFNRILTPGIFNSVQRNPNLAFYDARRESSVKTFEYVEGATLTGSVATENKTAVFVTVQLQTNTGRNFTYIQRVQTDRNGDFSVTVPYPTDNTVTPANGGTDSGVTARDSYRLFAGNPLRPTAQSNVSVPESAIYDGETIQVAFTDIEYENETGSAGNNSTSANTSSVIRPSLKHTISHDEKRMTIHSMDTTIEG